MGTPRSRPPEASCGQAGDGRGRGRGRAFGGLRAFSYLKKEVLLPTWELRGERLRLLTFSSDAPGRSLATAAFPRTGLHSPASLGLPGLPGAARCAQGGPWSGVTHTRGDGAARAGMRGRGPRPAPTLLYLPPAGRAPPTPRGLAANAEGPRARARQWERALGLMDTPLSANGDGRQAAGVAPASADKSRPAGLRLHSAERGAARGQLCRRRRRPEPRAASLRSPLRARSA